MIHVEASYDQGFVMWTKLVSAEIFWFLTQSDKKNNKFCACGLGGLVDRSRDGKCPPMSRKEIALSGIKWWFFAAALLMSVHLLFFCWTEWMMPKCHPKNAQNINDVHKNYYTPVFVEIVAESSSPNPNHSFNQ